MELRAYWSIIWRHIWVIALVVGVVTLYAGYQYYHLRKTPGALKTYQSTVTLLIGLQVPANVKDHTYSDFVSTSESIADEFTTGPVLTSNEFDTLVVQQIRTDTGNNSSKADLGDWQNPGAIGGALSANRYHSLVMVSVTWITPAGAEAIARAVGEVSVAHVSRYLDYVVASDTTPTSQENNVRPAVSAKVISGATSAVTIPGALANRPTLLLVLLLVALIIGIALAFLVDYLDDRIRNKETVVQLLQLPVYGEVPQAPSLGQAKPRRLPVAQQ